MTGRAARIGHVERRLLRSGICLAVACFAFAAPAAHGENLPEALAKAYQTNPALQELATTPLLLNLLILTYQGTTIHGLSTTQETLQQQLKVRADPIARADTAAKIIQAGASLAAATAKLDAHLATLNQTRATLISPVRSNLVEFGS